MMHHTDKAKQRVETAPSTVHVTAAERPGRDTPALVGVGYRYVRARNHYPGNTDHQYRLSLRTLHIQFLPNGSFPTVPPPPAAEPSGLGVVVAVAVASAVSPVVDQAVATAAPLMRVSVDS